MKSLFTQKQIEAVAKEIWDKLQSLTPEEYQFVIDEWKLNNSKGWARMVEKDNKKFLSLKLKLAELRAKTPQSIKDSIKEKFGIPEFWTNQPQETN